MTTVEPKVLNFADKPGTKYVIPLWLRDEQIKVAISRVKDRIQPHELRTDPIAIVGYGPSLKETWEEIRNFKYIISCSGAHAFLIERGIIPTWHAAVDPLPGNTVKLIGQPHPQVEYLIASTCHEDVFDHLDGFNVKLWHIFDNSEDARRTLPAGEWALTGGCDVGLRCLSIAHFFGFTDMHVFGLDGSAPSGTGPRHADIHPNPVKAECVVEYENRFFQTTPAMLAAAKGLWHELDQMENVTAKFYGDGLIQHMAKFYERKPPSGRTSVGVIKPELISPEYRQLNEQLHRQNLAYGVGGGKHADIVLQIAQGLNKGKKLPPSVLDYGCGKGYLAKALPFPIFEYDPAIPGKTESPRPADLVCCLDVLEHIEPDKLRDVLKDMKRCVKQLGFFTIHTGPASKTLPDGRNTHLIQKDLNWWRSKLEKFFKVQRIWKVGPILFVIVSPQ